MKPSSGQKKRLGLKSPYNSLITGFCVCLILPLAAAATENEDFYKCIPGMDSHGVSLPRGDIVKKVGAEAFPIYCHLNPNYGFYKDGIRADSLGFYAQHSLEGSDHKFWQLESRVLNATTIVAIYNPDRVTKDSVECKVRLPSGDIRGICTQYISVGYEPIPPENFTCISYNWQDLNCSWVEPFNPAKTKYELSYIEQGRYGRQRYCPAASNITRSSFCYLSLRTEPHFRQAMSIYRFLMNVTNGLMPNGTLVKLPVDVRTVVKPNPANMTLKAVDSHTIEVHYMIDHNLAFFLPGFNQLIQFKSEHNPTWLHHNVTDLNPENTEHNVTLESLIPYAEYTVKLKYISKVANHSDSRLWSEPTIVRGRTLPKIPDLCPDTNLGSFEVVNNGLQERTVYVYWKQIPLISQNGPNFKYRITEVNEGGVLRPLIPSKYTPGYAIFGSLGPSNYTFYVTSENSVGTANNTSKVFVPSHHELRGLQPRSFTKIAFSERFFEVSWLSPHHAENVIGYTIYWCKSEDNRDRPYQCEGQLDWKDVGNDTRTLNVTLPSENIYQFAVAANTAHYSSGMVWATCTILHNKVVGKLKTVSVDVVEKRSMRVSWRLDCSDRVGIVTGYKISYCRVESMASPNSCLEDEISTHEAPADAEHAWINDLEPWTVYKVAISVVTRAGESDLSDYLLNRTAQDRPGSSPRDLQVFETENPRTVRLDWKMPAKPNGPIDFYQIKFSFKNFQGDVIEDEATSKHLEMEIGGLQVNTNYMFQIRACTELPVTRDAICGQEWAARPFQTGIGESGRMQPPLVTFLNSTEVRIEWNEDTFHKGGPIRDYEIRVSYQKTGHNHTFRAKPVPGKSVVTVGLDRISAEQDWSPDCANASVLTNMYNFSIRAITIVSRLNQEFLGPWSKDIVVPAYCAAEIPLVLILCLTTIIPVCMVIATVYFCRCFNWSNRTSDLFKDVTKEMVHHAAKTNAGSTSIDDHHTSNSDQNEKMNHEMQERPTSQNSKRPNYVRAGSKDSMETLLTANPKRNVSGNSDTTSGCESGGPSCEDSDEAEDPERPINSSDKKKRSSKISECRTNSSSSFNRPEEEVEEEEEEEEVETPKAVDPANFMIRLPPPSPPPLQHNGYVRSFPIQMMNVTVPAAVTNMYDDYSPGSVTSSVPTSYSYCPGIGLGQQQQQQQQPPPPRLTQPSNGYVSFASVRDMSRNLPTVSSQQLDPDQSDPSTPTSLTGSYESPPITPTPYASSFNANTPTTMLSNSNFDFGSQIQFDLENIRIKLDNHQVTNNVHPMLKSKVSPMPNNVEASLPSAQQQQQQPSEFVIFPRELHVESRAPHNRIVSTIDVDRRYTMV